MDHKDLESLLISRYEQLKEFVNRQLPVKIGVMSMAFFQNNFRLQGFLAGMAFG
jgi:hypothetical protein